MIPRIIHQYWNSGTLPDEYLEYSFCWVKLHPDWDWKFYDDRPIQMGYLILQNRDLFDQAHKISPKAVAQFKSDVLRYELLYQFGGVWVDVDIKPQKPIDELCRIAELSSDSCWACWEEPDRWVSNAILASSKGNPLMGKLIEDLPGNVAKYGPMVGNTVKSGPQFITPYALDYENFTAYPREYFFPYLWNELHRENEAFPNAFGIHRWNNRRSRHER